LPTRCAPIAWAWSIPLSARRTSISWQAAACAWIATVSPALGCLVDLPGTFLAAAGAPIPSDQEGLDLGPTLADPEHRPRQAVVIEERPGDRAFIQRLIIDERWKLAWYAQRPWGELYDLADDPHHVRNLWDSPAHAPIRARLIDGILAHEVGRRRPNPGPQRAAELATA
jgi:arylsulfatase A-like enzyme